MKNRKISGLSVDVYNDNFEKAFRMFRKKVQKAGVVQEVRDRKAFIKPNEKKRLAKKAAKRKNTKELTSAVPKRLY